MIEMKGRFKSEKCVKRQNWSLYVFIEQWGFDISFLVAMTNL